MFMSLFQIATYISLIIRHTEFFYPVPNRRIFYEDSTGPYRSKLGALVIKLCHQPCSRPPFMYHYNALCWKWKILNEHPFRCPLCPNLKLVKLVRSMQKHVRTLHPYSQVWPLTQFISLLPFLEKKPRRGKIFRFSSHQLSRLRLGTWHGTLQGPPSLPPQLSDVELEEIFQSIGIPQCMHWICHVAN